VIQSWPGPSQPRRVILVTSPRALPVFVLLPIAVVGGKPSVQWHPALHPVVDRDGRNAPPLPPVAATATTPTSFLPTYDPAAATTSAPTVGGPWMMRCATLPVVVLVVPPYSLCSHHACLAPRRSSLPHQRSHPHPTGTHQQGASRGRCWAAWLSRNRPNYKNKSTKKQSPEQLNSRT
jgi:hypothetical protein